MTRHRHRHRAALVASLVTGAACGSPDSPRAGEPTMPTLRAEGTVAGPFEFEAAPSVAWVSDSVLGVIDQSDQQVVLLTLDGRELARAGGRGGGPAEFRGATSLIAAPDGGLAVADAEGFKIVAFSASLTFTHAARTPGMPYQLISFDGDATVVAWSLPAPGSGPVVGRVTLDSGHVTVLVDAFTADTNLAAIVPGVGLPPQFLAAAGTDAGFIVGTPVSYFFTRFDHTGRPTGTLGRTGLAPLEHDSADRAAIREQMRKTFAKMGRALPAAALEAADRVTAGPRPYFRTTGIAAGSDGRLYVATEMGARGASAIDVFEPDGRYLGTLTLSGTVRALAVRGTRMLALAERTDAPYQGQSAVDLYVLD